MMVKQETNPMMEAPYHAIQGCLKIIGKIALGVVKFVVSMLMMTLFCTFV